MNVTSERSIFWPRRRFLQYMSLFWPALATISCASRIPISSVKPTQSSASSETPPNQSYIRDPYIEMPHGNLVISEVEQGVNFELERSVRKELIEYAFATAHTLNTFIEAYPDASGYQAKENLTNLLINPNNPTGIDLSPIAQSPTINDALELLETTYNGTKTMDDKPIPLESYIWPALITQARNIYPGAPSATSDIHVAHTMVDELFTKADRTETSVGGYVVQFENNWPNLIELNGGDSVYFKYTDGTSHAAVILATSTRRSNGEPVVLVSHSNRYVNENNEVVQDGRVRIEWMTNEIFMKQMGFNHDAVGGNAVVNRPWNMGINEKSINNEWVNEFQDWQKSIMQGNRIFGTRPIADYMTSCFSLADSMEFESSEKYVLFMKNALSYSTETINHDISDTFWKQYNQLVKSSLGSDEYRPIDGLAEVSLYTEVINKGPKKGVLSGAELFNFMDKVKNIPIETLIKDPKQGINEQTKWFTTNDLKTLTIGDVIFTAPTKDMKGTVGIVTEDLYDGSPGYLTVHFFHQDGSPLNTRISATTWNSIKNTKGTPYEKFGVLRSLESEKAFKVEALKKHYMLPSKDIPDIIKSTPLGQQINYEKIPQILNLRKQLYATQTVAERSKILMNITALLGAQTTDNADGVWIDDNSCNSYAVNWMRALGLEKDISRYVNSANMPSQRGTELGALDMYYWMNAHAEKFNWIPVSQLSEKDRLDLLAKGYLMFGAAPRNDGFGHNWVVFGIEGDTPDVIPVLSQATYNMMATYPVKYPIIIDDPNEPAEQQQKFYMPKDEGTLHTMWAHKIPTS